MDVRESPEAGTTTRRAFAGDVVISVQEAHVHFRVHSDRRRRLKDRLLRRESSWVDVHAVRGLSFDLRFGETLGIIGPNGSGKSSLLRAIAGLLPTSSGQILVRWRPVLLGIGAALQPELSGRRNIYLGCLALGMSAAESRAHVEEIIEFSGLRKSIDLPLRTYSDGMKGRLQFAVATAIVPDLLLLDEAFAVGDAEFRRRSQQRIRNLRNQAGGIVMVSHSREEIVGTCTRAIWLDNGRLMDEGHPVAVFDAYTAASKGGAR